MDTLEIIMPAIVLGLSFALKLFIDRSTTLPDTIESVLELPGDITFLASSLIVGFTISSNGNAKEGLAWFSFYIFSAIFIVFLWRRSIKYFTNNSHVVAFCLAAINYLLAITALVNSIKLITGASHGTT